MEKLIMFLAHYRVELLTLHLLGTALGLGGATIADILFLRFLRDFRFSPKEIEVLRILSKVIVGALIVLLITGTALYLPKSAELNTSPRFLMKVVTVAVITVNGVTMHIFIIPHLIVLSFLPQVPGRPLISHTLHRFAFALGGISLTSWYSAFLLAMLKPLFNTMNFPTLLIFYMGALLIAIGCSQIAQARIAAEALHRGAFIEQD